MKDTPPVHTGFKLYKGEFFMRKIILIQMVFLLFFTGTEELKLTKRDALIDLATLIENNSLEVDNWEVIWKERLARKEVPTIINKLKDRSLVTVKDNENVIKYLFETTQKKDNISLKFQLIIPKQTNVNPEFIAVFKGDSWDQQIMDIYKREEIKISDLFTYSSNKYTCIGTKENDIIEIRAFLDKMENNLNLLHRSTQFDTVNNSTHKKIIYGYTALWEQKFIINDRPQNVQIVEKHIDKDRSIVTIGTPILVNEY